MAAAASALLHVTAMSAGARNGASRAGQGDAGLYLTWARGARSGEVLAGGLGCLCTFLLELERHKAAGWRYAAGQDSSAITCGRKQGGGSGTL